MLLLLLGRKKKNKSEVVWRGSLNACGSRELPLNVSKEEEKEEERLDGWLWPLATVSENTHPSSGCVSDWSQHFQTSSLAFRPYSTDDSVLLLRRPPPAVDTQTRCLVKIGPGRTDLGGRWRIPAVDVHWIFPNESRNES